MTFGERVRQARKRKKLTLKQLGDALRVSPQAVAAWEKSENAISTTRLVVLANALGVDYAWLLDGDESDPRRSVKGVQVSEFEARYEYYTPVIRAEDAIFFDRYSVQTDRVPQPIGFVLPTHELTGPTFAIEIEDDILDGFSVGDVVILHSDETVRNGDFGLGVFFDDWRNPIFGQYNYAPDDKDNPGVTILNKKQAFKAGISPGIVLGVMVEHRRFRPGHKKTSWSLK